MTTNSFFWRLLIISINIPHLLGQVDPSLLCSQSSCSSAVCPPTAEECNIQNSTHSGIWIPSNDICNCCDYCLVYLGEGETCSKGNLGSPPSGTVCGFGLSCENVEGEKYSQCIRMKSECHTAQDIYYEKRQDGTLGFLETKPDCDEDGLFAPNKCIPGQTRVCLTNEGERIFGEKINDKGIMSNMNCLCSRNWFFSKSQIDGTSTSTRCLSDGDFDPLQCIKNRCFCVRKDSGTISSSIVIDSNTQSLKKLPCFDPDLHNDRAYRTKCEEEQLEMMELIKKAEMEEFSILGNPIPNCQPDGAYDSVQIKNDSKVCVDKQNNIIENFKVSLQSSTASNMNCKCARTYNLLKKSSSAVTIPFCCKNGNWSPLQCRRGNCYCVDEDGFQTIKEVSEADIEKLPCYNSDWKNC